VSEYYTPGCLAIVAPHAILISRVFVNLGDTFPSTFLSPLLFPPSSSRMGESNLTLMVRSNLPQLELNSPLKYCMSMVAERVEHQRVMNKTTGGCKQKWTINTHTKVLDLANIIISATLAIFLWYLLKQLSSDPSLNPCSPSPFK
jgi:hypothetical protein